MSKYLVITRKEGGIYLEKRIFTEFREFISRGSVVDLAVDVIIGGVFTTIVTLL